MIESCREHGAYTGGRCPRCAPAAQEAQAGAIVTGALDLAKYHDYSAMVDGTIKLHEARVRGIKIWPHVDYLVVIEQAAARYARTGMSMLGVDATGVGEPISEMFTAKAVRTQDVRFGEYVEWTNPFGDRERAPVKYAMVEYARACMQHGFVKLPAKGAEELLEQLREQEIVVSASERPRYAHPEGRHDDAAWAFMIWLYVSRPWLTGNGMFAMEANSAGGNQQNYYSAWEQQRR